jgi:hypothetical protein
MLLWVVGRLGSAVCLATSRWARPFTFAFLLVTSLLSLRVTLLLPCGVVESRSGTQSNHIFSSLAPA